MLTLKRNLPKLLIALAEVKASNTSENLLNEVIQMMYVLREQRNQFNTIIIQGGYYIYEFSKQRNS